MVPPVTPEVSDDFVGLPAPLQSAASVDAHQGDPFHPQHPTGRRAENSGPCAQEKRGEGKWGVKSLCPPGRLQIGLEIPKC